MTKNTKPKKIVIVGSNHPKKDLLKIDQINDILNSIIPKEQEPNALNEE